MSSNSGVEVTAFLLELNYTTLSSSCLLYYDHLLILDREVHLIWRSPIGRASIFYVLIRYGFLIEITITMLSNARVSPTSGVGMTPERCREFFLAAAVLNIVNYVAVSACIATRIFAIWYRNWYIAVPIFLMGLIHPAVLPAAAGLVFPPSDPGPWPTWGCELIVKDGSSLFVLFAKCLPLVASVVNMTYELTCLVLTAMRTVWVYRVQRSTGSPARLTSSLLRDGCLYFATMMAIGIIDISFSAITTGNNSPLDIQVNDPLARVLTVILTSRFILHLRQEGVAPGTEADDLSTIEFTSRQAWSTGMATTSETGEDSEEMRGTTSPMSTLPYFGPSDMERAGTAQTLSGPR